MSSVPSRPPLSPGAAEATGARGAAVYVAYDGLLEPLGQSQVVPYVLGLAERGLPPEAFVLIYTGSLGSWYMGPETMALAEAVGAAVAAAGRPFRFVVLTRETEEARTLATEGLEPDLIVRTVPHGEVARWVSASNGALSLVRPSFSKIASAPTKLGEYLACGVPVVSTRGIGDGDALLAVGTGVLLDDTAPAELEGAAAGLIRLAQKPETRIRCRTAAERFSLTSGVDRLDTLYRQLTGAA